MCPARARGLEKRREQSLHVVFAMARESLRLSELSVSSWQAGAKMVRRESVSERESCGGS